MVRNKNCRNYFNNFKKIVKRKQLFFEENILKNVILWVLELVQFSKIISDI